MSKEQIWRKYAANFDETKTKNNLSYLLRQHKNSEGPFSPSQSASEKNARGASSNSSPHPIIAVVNSNSAVAMATIVEVEATVEGTIAEAVEATHVFLGRIKRVTSQGLQSTQGEEVHHHLLPPYHLFRCYFDLCISADQWHRPHYQVMGELMPECAPIYGDISNYGINN